MKAKRRDTRKRTESKLLRIDNGLAALLEQLRAATRRHITQVGLVRELAEREAIRRGIIEKPEISGAAWVGKPTSRTAPSESTNDSGHPGSRSRPLASIGAAAAAHREG